MRFMYIKRRRRRGWKRRWIIFGWCGFIEKCGFVDTLDIETNM
jgi:hypothetical protein